MKGLKLTFTDAGLIEFTAEAVEGLACVRQNAMVVIGTSKGSDAIYPDKGTDLLRSSVRGVAHDVQSAQHVANFAALDVSTFVREHEYPSMAAHTIETLQLELREIAIGYLKFQAVFRFTNGETITTQQNI